MKLPLPNVIGVGEINGGVSADNGKAQHFSSLGILLEVPVNWTLCEGG